ncbi:hypothetical protein R1flu_026315 [Riccia fluitans]|uniref:Uncharacterized protein n=1 Tax=Riccia fluitans TaxID=41844 RepID=A0ABD1XFM4_9MARC
MLGKVATSSEASPMEASASPAETNYCLESLTGDVLGRPCQMVDQNEACLISLESSWKMLSNDTKSTLSPFIDRKFAREGDWFAYIGKGSPPQAKVRLY